MTFHSKSRPVEGFFVFEGKPHNDVIELISRTASIIQQKMDNMPGCFNPNMNKAFWNGMQVYPIQCSTVAAGKMVIEFPRSKSIVPDEERHRLLEFLNFDGEVYQLIKDEEGILVYEQVSSATVDCDEVEIVKVN